MKRIIVIGCPGSGKSTFSRELQKRTGISLYHLDLMFWNEDKTTVEKSVFLERLNEALSKETWIIDGNYGSTMELRMNACDTIFFLDYPPEICLEGVRERRGKPRSDMPWIETEEDEKFIEFIKSFNVNGRKEILRLIEMNNDKKIIIFNSRDQADRFITEKFGE